MVDVVAHVRECLDRINETNQEINAVIEVNLRALEDAKAVQAKIDAGTAGRLAGKVIGIKSSICVKGMRTTCASKTLESWVSPYDADAVAAIREEDGVIIGMLNMDEFASGSSGEHSAYGPTRNPRAMEFIPGGSSSGSAAAVAAGYCDMSLGSDTGGSIRNPASHCGVVGIKPCYGRVSRYGLIDLSMSLDQIGPFARTVEDAALLLEVISKKSTRDSTMLDDSLPELGTPKALRIGLSPQVAKLCTDKRLLDLVDASVKSYLEQHGGTVVDTPLQHIDLAVQAYYPICYVEFFSGTRKFDGRKYGDKIEMACGVEVLRRILGGQTIAHAEHEGKYYKKALVAMQIIADELAASFERCDVIVLPTTPSLPHKLGTTVDLTTMYGYDAFTIPANLAGISAASIPMGELDGIPVGLQVYAPSEDVLFSALRGFSKK